MAQPREVGQADRQTDTTKYIISLPRDAKWSIIVNIGLGNIGRP